MRCKIFEYVLLPNTGLDSKDRVGNIYCTLYERDRFIHKKVQ